MRLRVVAALFAVFFSLPACSKSDDAVDRQRTSIESYLSAQTWSESVETFGGIYRYIINSGRADYATSPQAESGDRVVINYSLYLFSSSQGESSLIYTNNPELQQELQEDGLNVTHWPQTSDTVTLGRTKLIRGLAVGLPGCRQGDTLKLFMCSDMGYGGSEFATLPANTPLVWNVGIQEVIKK